MPRRGLLARRGLLVRHFLKTQPYNKGADGTQRVRGISAAALECLQRYQWPGNVRELVNVIERAVSFCDGDTIVPADLPEHVRDAAPAVASGDMDPASTGNFERPVVEAPRPPRELVDGNVTFKDAKEQWVSSFERDYIVSLLKRHGGNISHAARDADIDRKYFRKLMKKYDIDASVADE